MFTRALLFLACCLPVLYAGWPRPSLLGVSLAAGTGLTEQERRILNMDPDSLEAWSGMRVRMLQEYRMNGPALHDRCQLRECLFERGTLAGVDQLWHCTLEGVAGQWLLSCRWITLDESQAEQVAVRVLPSGDTLALRATIREWLSAQKE